jgi:hypothetical protein
MEVYMNAGHIKIANKLSETAAELKALNTA